MKFGVALFPNSPFKELVADAKSAERNGFTHVLVPDYQLLRDTYCALTLIASSTTTVKLGPCTTNPYTRHPAVTAAAIASLNEISGGRAVLILAQGGLATTRPLGLSRASSKEALKDAVAIMKGLWRHGSVTHSGIIRVQNARLGFSAAESPLYMAATGPSMLELAGEIADGVLVNVGIANAQLKFALEHFEAGLKRARNPPDRPFRACWVLGCSISRSREKALNEARPQIALILANLSSEILKVSQVERLASANIRSLYYSAGPDAAAKLVTDRMVKQFTIAGTLREAVKDIEGIVAQGFDEIVILPEEERKSRKDIIGAFGKEIIPSFS